MALKVNSMKYLEESTFILKLVQQIEQEGMYFNSFYETNISLIPKQEKKKKKKKPNKVIHFSIVYN